MLRFARQAFTDGDGERLGRVLAGIRDEFPDQFFDSWIVQIGRHSHLLRSGRATPSMAMPMTVSPRTSESVAHEGIHEQVCENRQQSAYPP